MKYRKTFEDLFAMAQEHDTAPSWALGLKLQEEVGEFSEAVLFENGFIQYKTNVGSPMEEAADIMNVVVSALAKIYPNKHPRELNLMLLEAMNKKGAKYARLIGADDYFNE